MVVDRAICEQLLQEMRSSFDDSIRPAAHTRVGHERSGINNDGRLDTLSLLKAVVWSVYHGSGDVLVASRTELAHSSVAVSGPAPISASDGVVRDLAGPTSRAGQDRRARFRCAYHA